MPDQTPKVCATCGQLRSDGGDSPCVAAEPTPAEDCGHLRDGGICIECAVPEPTPAESPASETADDGEECANCEDDEAPLHRWYAKNGDLMWLCEDCHGKCFAWLWDQVEEARQESPATPAERPEGWQRDVEYDGTRTVTRRSVRWVSRDDEWVIPVELERAISSAAVAEEGHWRRLWQQTNARADRLERALEEAREVARDLLDGPAVCNCDEAYTGRGLHEPNAVHADYADAFARIRALVSTESREEGGER